MIYRLDLSDAHLRNPYRKRSTRRVPGNVPYVVDNLWEWTRPAEFPNRRHCVFCSPKVELAKKLGGTEGGEVFRVEPTNNAKIAQLEVVDARDHPDVKQLPRFILEQLGSAWLDAPLDTKQAVGTLWTPCLSATEVEQLFGRPQLAPLRERIRHAVRMWSDAHLVENGRKLPFPEGEVFFEADEWQLLSMV